MMHFRELEENLIRPAVSQFDSCIALVLNSNSGRRVLIWSSSSYWSSPWLGLYSVPPKTTQCRWDGFQRRNETLLPKWMNNEWKKEAERFGRSKQHTTTTIYKWQLCRVQIVWMLWDYFGSLLKTDPIWRNIDKGLETGILKSFR